MLSCFSFYINGCENRLKVFSYLSVNDEARVACESDSSFYFVRELGYA